jgi:hypothetical protein
MSYVKVKFADNKYNYVTSINPQCTLEEVTKHFVNTYFDMGIFPIENVQKCIDIEYFNSNNERVLK